MRKLSREGEKTERDEISLRVEKGSFIGGW